MAKNSESKLRANHKYDEKTYDTFKVRLPKGKIGRASCRERV